MWRALALARSDHERALSETMELSQLPDIHSVDFYNFACVCALATEAASESLDVDHLPKAQEELLGQAFAFLETAREKGLFTAHPEMVDQLGSDPDLDALRSGDRWQELLDSLQSDDEPLP